MAANPYTTNLELQLDARDIVGLSDGDSVETWEDSSAAGNDVTQSTSGRRPVYKTNIIGSNPVVRFSASSTKSLYATFASSWSGFSGVTVFSLCQFIETSTQDYPGFLVLHGGSGNDYNNANNLLIGGGTSNNYILQGRNSLYFAHNSTNYDAPFGGMVVGKPSLFGLAYRTGSDGLKAISEYGAYTTGYTGYYAGTPTSLLIGNRYLGAISTSGGFRFDIALMLIYKEYMSDSNISDVVDWILDEFDLHTQAAAGGGMMRNPGMSGGLI